MAKTWKDYPMENQFAPFAKKSKFYGKKIRLPDAVNDQEMREELFNEFMTWDHKANPDYEEKNLAMVDWIIEKTRDINSTPQDTPQGGILQQFEKVMVGKAETIDSGSSVTSGEIFGVLSSIEDKLTKILTLMEAKAYANKEIIEEKKEVWDE